MNKKAILIVLDSVGIGELPDAAAYGDAGADTLGHIIKACHPHIPNMMEMGLGHIEDISFAAGAAQPIGCYGKMKEVSAGKGLQAGTREEVNVSIYQLSYH